ncbi:hypothetical protein [Nocardia otitidiscaviarum]|uniref:hypothetical protein n=1 Tax=Nocardia otitidiscaviarum TaxID=1823 RepID=UPI000E0E2163|nr:hypothetical protein [Nocardia otitidiscaviarum]
MSITARHPGAGSRVEVDIGHGLRATGAQRRVERVTAEEYAVLGALGDAVAVSRNSTGSSAMVPVSTVASSVPAGAGSLGPIW